MLSRLVPFAFLALLALWEAAGSLSGPRGAASEADWAAVERFVRAEHRPGDLLTFSPEWISPIGRAHLGDLLPVRDAARGDADRYARVFAVRLRAARVPETTGRTLHKEHKGRLSVGLWTAQPAEIAYDFVDELAEAEAGGGRAEVHVAEVDYAPRRCILVQPGAGTVSLTYPAVRMGRTLVGYTGLDHFQQRKLGKGVVELAIYVGEQLKERIVHANDDGWRRFEIDTSGSNGQQKAVRFEVHAPDPRHRRFCLVAEART